MPSDLETYRQTLIELYLRLPDTPRRLSRFDLRLVRQLWQRQIPLTTVETLVLYRKRAGEKVMGRAMVGTARFRYSRLNEAASRPYGI